MSMLCIALVACNGNDNTTSTPITPNDSDTSDTPDPDTPDTPDTSVKSTDSTTKEQIIAELGKVESFTYDGYRNSELQITYFFGAHFYGYQMAMSETYYYSFIEGNCLYDIEHWKPGDRYVDRFVKVDFTGFDIADDGSAEYFMHSYIQAINDGEFTSSVENDNLKLEASFSEDDETTNITHVLTDFNTTTIPELPEEFQDYKTREATKEPVYYKLSADGTYYTLTSFDSYIRSIEVPAEHEGKSATAFLTNCHSSAIKTITLPTSITILNSGCDYNAKNGELHIIFKGTKAQWEAITNSDAWSKTEGVRITCTDGDYVVAEE